MQERSNDLYLIVEEVSRFNTLMIHIFLPQISRYFPFSFQYYLFYVYEILNTILC